MVSEKVKTPLLREVLGQVLRDMRKSQKRTLREVSATAKVSLGYLSEVERGQKEASSELLVSISNALEVPLAVIMRQVSLQMAVSEGILAVEKSKPASPICQAV